MNILIVEDDRELALAISEFLELQGAQCDFAYNGATGISLAREGSFDCLVLDNMLPRVGGTEVCRTLRADGVQTPILMLTACDTDSDQIIGFESGLDDYVVKPCPMPLLWARLQALHRRNHPVKSCITIEDLCIYPREHKVVRGGQVLKLTPTSYCILLYLARNTPNLASRSEIEAAVWPEQEVEAGTLNVHLHHLRKVIDKPFDRPLLHTHVGVGLSLRGADNE